MRHSITRSEVHRARAGYRVLRLEAELVERRLDAAVERIRVALAQAQ